MANPTWPGTLPQSAYVDNWSEEPEDANVEFPVEVGPPKRRRRISSPGSLVEHNILLTVAQRAILLDFYNDDCEKGATYFDWVHPIDGGSAVVWQFASPPKLQLISGSHFSCALKLRKIP